MATNSLLINPAISHSLPYDTAKDFAPVSMIAVQPVALVANKYFEVKTVSDVVAVAKKQAINYTSPGPRGVGDLAGQMLRQRAGIPIQNLTHINYNGSAPALTDVIAGRIPIMFDLWSSVKPYIADGKLKVLAVASAQRLQDAPQYPTMAETFPGFDVSAFQAIAVPKGVPPALIEKISADIGSVVSSAEFSEKVGPLGVFPKATSPEGLDALIRKEIERWTAIAKAANITVE